MEILLSFVYGLFWVLVLTSIGVGLYYFVFAPHERKQQQRRRTATAGGPSIQKSPLLPAAPAAQQPIVSQRATEVVAAPVEQRLAPAPGHTSFLHLIPPRTRKHTGIAGATGDGKTATFNTLLVADIASGAHCVVCNTHFTAYHPEDQPIDLRPIEHLFEVAFEVKHIQTTIARVVAESTRRLELYRAGQDVGQDMVLYVGEWGSVKRHLGAAVVDQLTKLLDEGRKTRVWLVVEYHSLLVSRTGGDSALREMYTTLLAGNVDPTTWKFVVGEKIEQHPVPIGTWMTEDGPVRVVRPGPEFIGHLSLRAPSMSLSFTTDVSSDSAVDDEMAWGEVKRLAASIDAETKAETTPKPFQEPETSVSPTTAVQTEDDDPFRNVDFTPLARLVKAKVVTETVCLETAFGVKAGAGQDYQTVRAKLKKALQDIEVK